MIGTRKTGLGLAMLMTLVLLLSACGGTGPTEAPADATSPPEQETQEPAVESQFPLAEIQNDEGGPVVVTGDVAYTYAFFTDGVAQPLVILEDQGGFVARDRNFVIPASSQVMGQITSDFNVSPFTYSVEMPIEPQATLNDVDNDGETDTGVMIYAVAYWTNAFGDPFLEERDQGGGGWSSAYASTRVSDDRDAYLEVYGGKYVIYAPEAGQGFPSGFGSDGKLFTEDDPIVGIPAGWMVVDMDSDPFTFDRSAEPKIDLLEPESLALDDFSEMSYTEAFDAMLEKFRNEYAFTEYKNIDWDAMAAEFRPRFEEAEQNSDVPAYLLALRDFTWTIPDTHVGISLNDYLNEVFASETAGGLGMAIMETDDGRVYVSFLTEGGPAAEAGIQFGAEILELNGTPIGDAISASVPWSSPFSNPESKRLQQLRYAVRFPANTEVEVSYQNPNGAPATATLTTTSERDSFSASSFYAGVEGTELPVEFRIMENGYGYVKVFSFFDNDLLTVQLWERMIQTFNAAGVPGVIIDMRQNGGGSGWLADQMAAYFFHDRTLLGNVGYYDDSTGEFYFDQGDEETFIPPPNEALIYDGTVVVLVGPGCASACEFFSYNMTLDDRARIVGQYPTAGAGGSVEDFVMPEDISVRITKGRAVNAEGEIHIEGTGVVPDVDVPVTLDSITRAANGEDVILDAAIAVISQPVGAGVTPSGPPTLDTTGDLIALAQGGTSFLEDFANESYDETSQTGQTYLYTVPLNTSRDLLWTYAWCTADQASFDDNWSKITVAFALDGQDLPLNRMGTYEGAVSGQICRFYWALLSDWPAGEHVLTSTVNFSAPLNDGFADYPAGQHVYEYHVYVARD